MRFDIQNNTETSENNNEIDPGIINLWNEIFIIVEELGELYKTTSLNHPQTIEPGSKKRLSEMTHHPGTNSESDSCQFSNQSVQMNQTKAPSPVSDQPKHFLSLHHKNGCAKKVSAILLGLVMVAVGVAILKLCADVSIGYGLIAGGLTLFFGGLAFLSQQKISASHSPKLGF